MKTFSQEFRECAGDVIDDFRPTFEDLVDQDLIDKLKSAALGTIISCGANPAELTRQLVSMQFAFFLVGREHAQRGYASPIGRGVSEGVSSVPDDISDLEG